MMIYPAYHDGAKPNHKRKQMLPVGIKSTDKVFANLGAWNLEQIQNQECDGKAKNRIAERFNSYDCFLLISSISHRIIGWLN